MLSLRGAEGDAAIQNLARGALDRFALFILSDAAGDVEGLSGYAG